MSAPDLLIDGTIRVSAILFFALAAVRGLRTRSAAARHWVLAVAILSAALLPAYQVLVPAWQLAGRPEPVAVRTDATTAAAEAVPAEAAGENAAGAVSAPENHTIGQAATGLDRAAVWIWLTGVGVFASLFLAGFARLSWLARRASRITTGAWAQGAERVSREYGVTAPALLQSGHPSLLVAWGLSRPQIILPAEASSWSIERTDIVLRHEIAHIARSDWPMQLLAEALRAACWFNPLVWMACRRLRLESERACDDAVIARGISGAQYAEHLLDLARSLRPTPSALFPGWPAPAMARPSSLRMRIAAMLDATHDRRPLSRRVRFALMTLIVAFAALAATAQTSLATIWGILADQNGGLIANTKVTLAAADGSRKYEVRSDPTGRFEFIGLPAGDYQIGALKPGFRTASEPVSVAAGQTLHHNVELRIGTLAETMSVSGGGSDAGEPVVRQLDVAVDSPCTPSAEGGQIKPPVKRLTANAQYPPSLRGSGVEGVAVLTATIGTDGFLREIQAVEPAQPDLAQAAMAAVGEWQFTPTLLNCVAVEVPITVHVKFASGR